jgi:hypothetical protein
MSVDLCGMKILRGVLAILALGSGAAAVIVLMTWGEHQDPVLTLCVVVVTLVGGLTRTFTP